ncbi:unnamed protein product [Lupinus luteus]|uniref:ZF-HD dimerization-type domain-containing protein n=1 Tax=Lupinus luteus TaxID=3873 RepID=A0AAV1WT77_LUPLU
MEGGGPENSNSAYRECLRNHAASLGSYATDGCGEFTVDNMSPAGLQCAACGCHRNFHRKLKYPPGGGHRGLISYTTSHGPDPETTTDMMDYSGGGGGEGGSEGRLMELERSGSGKKRFRSKFTADQKEKMLAFAEKLGWKLQRKDLDDEIERFCKGIGVSRQVFKVWMHNHKNSSSSSSASTGNVSSLTQ